MSGVLKHAVLARGEVDTAILDVIRGERARHAVGVGDVIRLVRGLLYGRGLVVPPAAEGAPRVDLPEIGGHGLLLLLQPRHEALAQALDLVLSELKLRLGLGAEAANKFAFLTLRSGVVVGPMHMHGLDRDELHVVKVFTGLLVGPVLAPFQEPVLVLHVRVCDEQGKECKGKDGLRNGHHAGRPHLEHDQHPHVGPDGPRSRSDEHPHVRDYAKLAIWDCHDADGGDGEQVEGRRPHDGRRAKLARRVPERRHGLDDGKENLGSRGPEGHER
mmetsp:Transcript_12800/g.40454  ORF Transcript_12800/g.40454 Transcript_12800/m.40454 type:complete len:273 (-) Transcript_12800:578-1396(-)